MSLREAAQQALEAMACMRDMVAHPDNLQFIDNAITALRTALSEPEQKTVPLAEYERLQRLVASQGIRLMEYESEPEQEPVAWRDPRIKSPGQGCTYDKAKHDIWPHLYPEPLYTHPPQRKPLSDEKVWDIYYEMIQDDRLSFARAIERAHGIGGEA